MRQAALLVALACLVVAPLAGAGTAVGPATAAGDPAGPSLASASDPQLQSESLDREGVHIAVQLEEDGDARWNVSATYHLEDENETAAFDRLAAAFKAGEADSGFSVAVFEAAAPTVSDRVGRPMEITDDRRAATTVDRGNNSTGVLSLQFTWTNFAAVSNETMTVDSFTGSWFGDLQAGQSLSIRAPEDYDPDTVEPTTTVVGGAYQWDGPQAFDEGEPSLVFTSSPLGGDGDLSVLTIGGVVAAVGALGAVGVWLYRRSDGSTPGRSETGSGGDAGASANSDRRAASAEGAAAGEASGGGDANGVDDGVGGTDTAEGAESAGAGSGGGGAGVDPELLSDEERVEQLLAANGGRMKQSKIVEETRWSTAKVSQLLSSMAEAGRVEKLRIGRENLISLPGEGIDSGGDDDDGGGE